MRSVLFAFCLAIAVTAPLRAQSRGGGGGKLELKHTADAYVYMPPSGVQAVAALSTANSDNWYAGGSVAGYFSTGRVAWTISGSYVDATNTTNGGRVWDTTYAPVIPVRESLTTRDLYHVRRGSIGVELDIPSPRGLGVGVFTVLIRESGTDELSNEYHFSPLPNPNGWDTTIVTTSSPIVSYMLVGAHASVALGGDRLGMGGLAFKNIDISSTPTLQGYLHYVSNRARLISYDLVGGVVKDSVLRPFAEVSMRWQITPDVTLVPGILYCGSAFYYDVQAHFMTFYHDLNAVNGSLTGVFDMDLGWKVFIGATVEHNDRLTMGGVTLGTFVQF